MGDLFNHVADFLDGVAASPKLALVPAGVLLLGLLGYIVNRRGGKTSRRSLALAERQEARREALLDIRLISATCAVDDGERNYVYDLVIRNPSDRANSVAEAELWLEYEVGGLVLNVKAPWRPSQAVTPPGNLRLPLALAANGSEAGSLQITVAQALIEGRSIERLQLVLTDTFGTAVTLRSEFVQERISHIEATND
ncbi:hypothetical protein [Nocardioides sp.]|uniref:hypothetical protein n=1 Tax=Nocardioides sp. TaxID=35761 RepID=UPI002B86BA21|nr:hypothetical protein [Nocardioides sp.]HSX69002.1 hypothetical protein [Nocardioides sp.]